MCTSATHKKVKMTMAHIVRLDNCSRSVIKKVLDEVNFPMVGTVLAGCVLVLCANWTSKSMAIRVTGGGLVVGLMMGMIVFCWLRITLCLQGCSVLGAAVGMSAWLAGFWWLPSLTFLITNTYLVAWVGFFWFIGLVSVYMGGAGMNNPRLETLLALSFRLLGHVLLYIRLWKCCTSRSRLLISICTSGDFRHRCASTCKYSKASESKQRQRKTSRRREI
ncbi:hypothetical protein VaNZ11_009111 [Volvox africanus]|uniref:DUF4203 domain-containing protein n=1 Tax=Volvox africanus TaxID=51714 RepID=A0ABQ5S6Z4_9CHLO|nr:hypothetical protein VaNZ11_009111 [Volvox africanus]